MKKFIIGIMAVAVASAIICLVGRNLAFLPRWVEWESGTYYSRCGEYEISLDRKTVRVLRDDAVIWTSPEGVKVQEALSWDIDKDSEDELILLCWKKGRYGRHKPFWVEEDEKEWSQHIFVYEYGEGEVRPKWMSSYIGLDVAYMTAGSGEDRTPGQSEQTNHLWLTDPEGKISCWTWDFWGFTREETEVSFVVFGDNLIHEPIYRYGLNQEGSFAFLYDNFRDVIARSDVAVINQETPFTDNPALYGGYPRFGTPVQVGQALADAGFDVVTCATNHVLDRGAAGIDYTKAFLEEQGVICLGIQAKEEKGDTPYTVIKRNGIRMAMLNYTYGTNGIQAPPEYPHMVYLLEDEEKVREDIEKAREEADFVIVFAHWGTEYAEQTDAYQQKWAQLFLESGVDVVVGTHPHVLQPCEVLRDEQGHEMLVYYSIGNFISAQREETCVKGGMAEFTISLTDRGYRITEYGLQPLVITRREGGRYTVDFE